MNKDVLVSIKGLQYTMDDGDDQGVETITRGQYYDKNGSEYITYDESPDGEETVKSRVKLSDGIIDITRKGSYSSHMFFELGKKNYTDYRTPFGNFIIGIDTKEMAINRSEDAIEAFVEYDMELNYELVGKCRIDMLIQSV